MIIAKYAQSLCALWNQIFSIGGYTGSHLADCEIYEAKGNTWKALPKLITPRRYCASLVYAKQWVYAIAGQSVGSSYLNSVERLPIVGNGSWGTVNILSMFSAR